MQLRPILSSLRHHKLTAMLLILQVSVTCAIVCNVAFMIADRVAQVTLQTGLDESSLSTVQVSGIEKNEDPAARHITDLTALRTIPGVTAAVAVDSLPLTRNESSYGMCASLDALDKAIPARSLQDKAGCLQPTVYSGTQGELAVLGLKLVAGRDFLPNEYVQAAKGWVIAVVPSAIISRGLAERLYHGQDALGRNLYQGDHHALRIVGIVDTLLRPRLRESAVNQDSVLVPSMPGDNEVTYVLRSAPQDRDRILSASVTTLTRLDANRLIPPSQIHTYTQIREAYFQRDITMIGLLLVSTLGLLFVTALGITGLANFWVQQRVRQIGIRRAIGATRGDILRYFQSENFLIVSAGIVFGLLLAVLLNLILMKHYELPRLPLYYLPIGALTLWALGQLAVLGPALRAAAVPPVVATRSV